MVIDLQKWYFFIVFFFLQKKKENIVAKNMRYDLKLYDKHTDHI